MTGSPHSNEMNSARGADMAAMPRRPWEYYLRIMLLWAVLAPLWFAGAAYAHDSRPLHVLVSETAPSLYRVQHFVPPSVEVDNLPELRVTCPHRQPLVYDCNGQTLAFTIIYPRANPGLTSVIDFHGIAGGRELFVLGPGELTWRLAADRDFWGQVKRFTSTGLFHVLSGLDHVLFLLLLVFVAGRRLIVVVTGFTLSHSISLGASALGWVQISAPAIEILIAMSIVFLAAEIIRPRRDTWGWRYPFLVTLGFGFIHGFGFANNLNDIGLPSALQIVALASFNIGVEIGQILIVVPVALMVAALRSYRAEMADKWLAGAMAWSMGAIASFWMWQRLMGVFMA